MSIDVPAWVQDAIFYQIFPDRFASSDTVAKPRNLQPWGASPKSSAFQGGDLIGVIEKLDYLEALGVNALYFNPIFSSASNHRYHTYDYFQVDPILGGNDALRRLIDAAHARNMQVVLDGVFNHASRGFWQFNHILECGGDSPYIDWFHIHGYPLKPYTDQPNYSAWWGNAALPKFNTDTPAVREFLWEVGTYWLEQGIDGWRLDVPNEIDDDSFWQEFRRRCRAVNPDCYIVGEIWDDATRWLQGDQFDAQMNYLFARAALGFFGANRLDRSEAEHTGYGKIATLDGAGFGAALNEMFNELYDPAIVRVQMTMIDSHDTPRMWTMLRDDEAAVRLAFLAQLTVPGAPNIYYGSEIGLPGKHDPDCRRAFPWHDAASWKTGLLAYVKQLIQLRHDDIALRRGSFELLAAQGHAVIFRRQHGAATTIVAINAGDEACTLAPVAALGAGQFSDALDNAAAALTATTTITLPAQSGRVWRAG